jgi:hypothetical protein
MMYQAPPNEGRLPVHLGRVAPRLAEVFRKESELPPGEGRQLSLTARAYDAAAVSSPGLYSPRFSR